MNWPLLAPLLQGSVHTRCIVNKVNNSIVIESCNHLQPCIADVISSRYPETYFASHVFIPVIVSWKYFEVLRFSSWVGALGSPLTVK